MLHLLCDCCVLWKARESTQFRARVMYGVFSTCWNSLQVRWQNATEKCKWSLKLCNGASVQDLASSPSAAAPCRCIACTTFLQVALDGIAVNRMLSPRAPPIFQHVYGTYKEHRICVLFTDRAVFIKRTIPIICTAPLSLNHALAGSVP